MLRSADKALSPAVVQTLDALTLPDSDAALAVLARRYAEAIDSADDEAKALEGLGPKLLATLAALQATPAARSRVKTEGGGDAGPNRLQALRDARGA